MDGRNGPDRPDGSRRGPEPQASTRDGPATPTGEGPATPRPYLAHVDGLRCVAVLLVVFYHLRAGLLPGGFVGVDVFFVISGFLMTGILGSHALDRAGLIRFAASRVRRIVPAYLVCLAVVAPLSVLVLFPGDLILVSKGLLGAPVFLTNLILMRQTDYFVTDDAIRNPILHTWSLGLEWQFYVVFPFAFVLARRRGARPWLVLAVLAVLSFCLSAALVRFRPVETFFTLPTRAWEFLVGGLVACGANAIRSRVAAEVMGCAGLGLILYPAATYSLFTSFPGPSALPPCLGAALILAGSRRTIVNAVLASGPFTAIGRASYSIYLWHWPLIVFADYRLSPAPSGAATACLAAASLALGFLSLRFVELPFRRRGGVAPRGLRPLALAGAVPVLLGAVALATAGLAWRFPPDVLRLAEVGTERHGPFMACVQNPAPTDWRRDLCRMGAAEAGPSFLLIGDSHAGGLATGFDAVAREAGTAGLLLAADACPPLAGLRGTYPPSRRRCARVQDAIGPLIDAVHPRLVILHGIWQTYLAREGDAFGRALDRTLADLAARRVPVVVISDVPGGRTPVPFGLARRAAFDLPLRIEPTRQEVEGEFGTVNALLKAAADRHGARYVDAGSVLCSATTCPVEEAGRPLYFDRTHLSAFGSEVFVRRLQVPLR